MHKVDKNDGANGQGLKRQDGIQGGPLTVGNPNSRRDPHQQHKDRKDLADRTLADGDAIALTGASAVVCCH